VDVEPSATRLSAISSRKLQGQHLHGGMTLDESTDGAGEGHLITIEIMTARIITASSLAIER
jgi:hypothetical protein